MNPTFEILLHFFPGDIRECKTSTELIFDVHTGSERRDKLIPCVHNLMLGKVCLPTAYTLLAVLVLLRDVGSWCERESGEVDLWH